MQPAVWHVMTCSNCINRGDEWFLAPGFGFTKNYFGAPCGDSFWFLPLLSLLDLQDFVPWRFRADALGKVLDQGADAMGHIAIAGENGVDTHF